MTAKDGALTANAGSGWILEEQAFHPEFMAKYEAIFSQGNGYLGQRAALDEQYEGQTRNLFVSGTFDRFHDSEVSELPNLPDVTNIGLRIAGQNFSMLIGRVETYSQKLNLYNGETMRQVCWVSPQGATLKLAWRRTVSMSDVHLLGSQVTLTTDKSVEVVITSGINGRVTNSGTQHMVEGHARVYDGSIMEYPCRTLNSGIQVVTHASHRLLVDGVEESIPMKIVTSRRYLGGKYMLRLEAGQTLVLEKLASVYTGRDMEYRELTVQEANARVFRDSLERFRGVIGKSYADVLEASSKVWARFWEKHDVQLESDGVRDQLAIRFAIYHLNIMTNHRDSRMGIGAKGLSGEGYKGHSFWDTEIFISPFFLFTWPEVGRNLLEYRYRTLSGARALAQKRGYQGAMYPWESAWIDDGDMTPDNLGVDLVTGKILPCETGEIEHHVTADIAFAVHQYYNATGDMEFLERCGFEILLETARFWSSRVEWNQNENWYEIRHVIGPDEYQVDVNNNAYTNYLAARNMELGLRALDRLDQNPELRQRLDAKIGLSGLRELLRERLGRMYLPQPDPESGIVPQFDGYMGQRQLDLTCYRNAQSVGEILKDYNFQMLRNFQVAKQADVVQLMFLCEELFPGDLRRKNYLYYEPRTLHDSSLSKAVHSILASDLGMMEEAYEMFRGAAETDLGPEPDSSEGGIHSANMGGIWQAAVMGFGGMRVIDHTLRIVPHLPRAWKRLNYRFCWQGNPLEVTVTHEQVRVFNGGPPIVVETIRGPVELQARRETVVQYESPGARPRRKQCSEELSLT
ncbi:MAG TPA: glycosyl hydrolase family 65 protein [Pseudoflavonifractor sp.]|nr:glycosyl hydrolase family 65 protein [Pseudoflavonifractor sp.]